MNLPLTSKSLQNPLLNNLAPDLFEKILWEANSVTFLSHCHQSCKSIKVFIDQKKLFSRFVTSGQHPIQVNELLNNFYDQRDICRAFTQLLKKEEPYFQLHQCITHQLVNEKISFIINLRNKVDLLYKQDTPNLKFKMDKYLHRLFNLADDLNLQVRQKSRQTLYVISIEASVRNKLDKSQCNEIKAHLNNDFGVAGIVGIIGALCIYATHRVILNLILKIQYLFNLLINTIYSILEHGFIFCLYAISLSFFCILIMKAMTYGIRPNPLNPKIAFFFTMLVTSIILTWLSS